MERMVIKLTPVILRWVLLGLVGYGLWKRELFILILGVVSLAVSFLALGFARKYPKAGHWDLTVTSLLFFHTVLGVTLGFYEKVPFYDKALHFVWAALIGLCIWKTLVFLSWDKSHPRVVPLAMLLVATLDFSLGGLWEIMEFSIDQLVTLPQPAQIDLCDTMCDLIANLVGALFAAVLVWISFRRQVPQARSVAQGYGNPINTG